MSIMNQGKKIYGRVKNKILYELQKIRIKVNIHAVQQFNRKSSVAGIDETLDKLIQTDCSLCRFGDGECKVMLGQGNGFQKADKQLAQRLKEIVKKNNSDHLLVCIPNLKEDMQLRTKEAGAFWDWFIREYGYRWTKFLNHSGQYYNAHVTRLYMDYQHSGKTAQWFQKIKKLWDQKDLLIVEGEHTKLGIGNDLYASAKSIKRILAPSHSAFTYYDEILEKVREVYQDELVLIALGQTATVLAFDLCNLGIRALDIGHIDIEYMWYLSGSTTKTAVPGKYVKEVDTQMSEVQSDAVYESQIIARIGG